MESLGSIRRDVLLGPPTKHRLLNGGEQPLPPSSPYPLPTPIALAGLSPSSPGGYINC